MALRMKKGICTLLGAMLLFAFVILAGTAPAQAAVKNGLMTSKKTGKIFYYENGKRLKNSWKTIKVSGKKQKFYFGKDGSAYKAKANIFGFYNVKVFTVGKKKYGFDMDGHLVSGGIYVDSKQNILAFTSTGKYNAKKTKSLQKKFRPFDVSHKVSWDLLKQVKKAFGKPLRKEISKTCKPWNSTDTFEDVKLIYKHFEVQLVHNKTTGEYALNDVYSC